MKLAAVFLVFFCNDNATCVNLKDVCGLFKSATINLLFSHVLHFCRSRIAKSKARQDLSPFQTVAKYLVL